MQIAPYLYKEKIAGGKPAEMEVNGTLRGGFVSGDLFYFVGAINSVAHQEVSLNDTLKIHEVKEE